MNDKENMDSWQHEVRNYIVKEFGFVSDQYGFVPEQLSNYAVSTNVIALSWHRKNVCIEIVADKYRNEIEVFITKKMPQSATSVTISLGDLIIAQRSASVPAYSNRLGRTPDERLQSIKRMGDFLRTFGKRAIAGDDAVFLKIEEVRCRRLDDSHRKEALKIAIQVAHHAWDRGDFLEVVTALEPVSEDLSPAEIKRLNIAKSRLAK
jgi:hypothetical protein